MIYFLTKNDLSVRKIFSQERFYELFEPITEEIFLWSIENFYATGCMQKVYKDEFLHIYEKLSNEDYFGDSCLDNKKIWVKNCLFDFIDFLNLNCLEDNAGYIKISKYESLSNLEKIKLKQIIDNLERNYSTFRESVKQRLET